MSCALYPLNIRLMVSPHSPALDGTLGALEVGTVAGTFLFGILTLQTFNYYRRFPKDSKTLKTTVRPFSTPISALVTFSLAEDRSVYSGQLGSTTV